MFTFAVVLHMYIQNLTKYKNHSSCYNFHIFWSLCHFCPRWTTPIFSQPAGFYIACYCAWVKSVFFWTLLLVPCMVGRECALSNVSRADSSK